LIDEVIADEAWPAGDNTSKKTMERDTKTLAWFTSASALGTPKAENSKQVTKTVNSQPLNEIKPEIKPTTTKTTTKSTTTSTAVSNDKIATSFPVAQGRIFISQVQITGGKGKVDNDFIEIYNPSNEKFNLKGYRLVKRTQDGLSDSLIKSWIVDTFIPANGFYLWENAGFVNTSVPYDTATTASLSDNNGVAIRFGSNDTGVIVDSVAWGKAQNLFVQGNLFPTNPGADQSIMRKNNMYDFALAEHAVPRNSQSK
jgi:hypothetical protein